MNEYKLCEFCTISPTIVVRQPNDVAFNLFYTFSQKRSGCLIKLLELTWEDKMSEGSFTLPHVSLSATLVPESMLPVAVTSANAKFMSP